MANKTFKTRTGIQNHILANYDKDIDFLVDEYGQDREYVISDYYNRMIEPEDLGHETIYNLTPDRRWESYTQWYNEIIEDIRNG